MSKPILELAGVHTHIGAYHILHGVDLAVPRGLLTLLLGRNGAGKTTAIRLITGLARPDAGRAWVCGVDSAGGDNRAAPLFGYLPQEPAFYGWMTAAETLDHAGRLFAIAAEERRQRVEELLRLVDLTAAARRRVGGFSGGMKQRLGLAAALIHRPQVLARLRRQGPGLRRGGAVKLDLLEALNAARAKKRSVCLVRFLKTHAESLVVDGEVVGGEALAPAVLAAV